MAFTSDVPLVHQVTPPQRAVFLGHGWTLFGIYLRNILLTVVTLGIYYFWGKNRTRQYLVSHCEYDGDRFAWHGTGRELLLGMLKFLIVAAPVVGVLIYLQIRLGESPAAAFVSLGFYALYALLVPLLAVGARRYRFSRLSWRGIRFSFRGRFWDFFKLYLGGLILTGLTLGLYYPYFQTEVRRFVTNQSYFGATSFAFDGHGKDLFKPYLLLFGIYFAVFVVASIFIGWALFSSFASSEGEELKPPFLVVLITLLALGVVGTLAWVWFTAFKHRYFWAHTSFAATRFRSTITAGRLLGLTISNLLLLIITLGLAFPWILVRSIRFFFTNVMVAGPLDLAVVVQDAQAAGATVESAADIFNVDIFGIDLPL